MTTESPECLQWSSRQHSVAGTVPGPSNIHPTSKPHKTLQGKSSVPTSQTCAPEHKKNQDTTPRTLLEPCP